MSRRRKVFDWLCWLLCPVGVIMTALLWASPVQAQPSANIIANTVQTTNTGATSLLVGCAIGSTTCTGTVSAGVVTANALGAEAGYVEIQSNVPASTTFRLYNSSGTLFWNGSAVAIGGSISGTTNTVPLFTSSNSIGNSIMTQSGTTITVANTLSATTLTGLLSTANQSNVTGLGTVTTGTWNATKIGLLYGGTNADLSGTGGTSQFLRQASVGAAITVVRPAVADLSDNSNIALLNVQNSFAINTNGAVANINLRNANAGSFANTQIQVGNDVDGALGALVAYSSTTAVSGMAGANAVNLRSNGTMNIGTTGSTTPALQLFTNNTLRWGINSAGDFTFGASAHLADSSGTPTIASGFGTSPTITGTDYAMAVTVGTTPGAGGTVNFGHTWSNIPVCSIAHNVVGGGGSLLISTTTTTLSTGITTGNLTAAEVVQILCRGF